MFYTCVSHIQPFVKIIGQFFLIKRFLQTFILQNGFFGPHFAICFDGLASPSWKFKSFFKKQYFYDFNDDFF